VELEQVHIEQTLPRGRRLKAEADRITVGYHPRKAFANRKRLIEQSRSLITSIFDALENGELGRLDETIGSRRYPLTRALKRLDFQGLTGEIHEPGDTLARFDHCDLQLTIDAFRARTFSVVGRSIEWGLLQLERARARGTIEHGRAVIERLKGNMFDGRLAMELSADLTSRRIESGAIDIRDIDLERLYQARGAAHGRIEGRFDCFLQFAPSVFHADSLQGTGRFKATGVVLDEIPLLKTIVVSSAFPFLSTMHLRSAEGNLVLDSGRVACADVVARGEPIDLTLSGWCLPDGEFRYEVLGTFPKRFEDSIDVFVWNAMLPAEHDKRSFICTISGTFDSPRTVVDGSIRKRAVRNVFQSLTGSLKQAFGNGKEKER
jgi:hypothetical protein